MLKKFLDTIHSHDLFTRHDHLLIAASGGLDSSVLCELCHQAGFHFTLVHCNFQLRGEESERDEEFVRSLGKKYHAEVLVEKFDTQLYAANHKLTIQEAARALRYNWFHGLLREGQYLLTAHHKDDSIETLLMNFFRGTGLKGLTGIPVRNNRIRRPLLQFGRQELENFAKEMELEWVEDSSNLSSHYTRNFFRNELLPEIEKVFPQVRQNLSTNIDRFTEIEKLYHLATGEIKKKLIRKKQGEFHIPVKQLMQFNSRALIYEIIADFGFNEKQLEDVIRLATGDSGKYINSPDRKYRIIRHRHWFIVSPAETSESENIILEKDQDLVVFEGGVLEMKMMGSAEIPTGTDVALLDYSLLEFPLLLRKWKTGDYFYPLGMRKKKKLSRFFIDSKLSKSEKEKIWVIESGNGRIAWVVSRRIDDRFKVTEKTKKFFQVRYKAGALSSQ